MKTVVLFTGIPFLVLLMLGCSSQNGEEQQLLDSLDAAVDAIEEQDTRQLQSLLAEDVSGPQQKRRDELAAMMQLYFRQYRHVRVFLRDTGIEMQGTRADVTTLASIVGAREHWPDSGRQFEVRMRWTRQPDGWKLQRIHWQALEAR